MWGTIQGILIPVDSILTSAGSVDHTRIRVPMMWDGRRVEVFVAALASCATQIEVPWLHQVAAAEQPIARKPPMPENASQKAKCA